MAGSSTGPVAPGPDAASARPPGEPAAGGRLTLEAIDADGAVRRWRVAVEPGSARLPAPLLEALAGGRTDSSEARGFATRVARQLAADAELRLVGEPQLLRSGAVSGDALVLELCVEVVPNVFLQDMGRLRVVREMTEPTEREVADWLARRAGSARPGPDDTAELMQRVREAADARFREALLEALERAYPIEIPPSLLRAEQERRGLDPSAHAASARTVERSLRVGLVLAELARALGWLDEARDDPAGVEERALALIAAMACVTTRRVPLDALLAGSARGAPR